MTLPGIALFLLMLQAPAAPAAIEGTVARALTGESLSKVTVTLTEVPTASSYTADIQSLGIPFNPINMALSLEVARQAASSAGPITTGQSRQTMTTASDGQFQFGNVKPGTYLLKATLGGYAPTEYGQRGPNGRGMTITLKAGQKMQGVSLTMTPGGSITGHVVDANGEPAIRTVVQAQKMVYQARGRALIAVQSVLTDDRGEYRLFWLPPGKYYISATPSDDRANTITAMLPTAGDGNAELVARIAAGVYGLARPMDIINGTPSGTKVIARTLANGEVIEEAGVPVFYPRALDVAAATAIEIRPGGITSGIDITTTLARVYRVRGRIISGVTGQSIPAGEAMLLQRNGTTAQQSRMSPLPNGSGFEIAGVLQGSYYLYAGGAGTAGQSLLAVSPIEVQAANLDNVIVTATAPFTIQGQISTKNTISNSASAPPPYIVRAEPMLPGPITGTSAAMKRDNSFSVPTPVAGDYRITVGAPPGTYVQSIRFGGQDVLRDGLHVDGPTSETLEIVVSPNAGRIEGDVSADRLKFANATVVLVPASALRRQTSLFQTVQSNAEGHFIFDNIAPGSYKVFAWEDVEALAWFDAEFMQTIENLGTEVVVREGAKENIEITVLPR